MQREEFLKTKISFETLIGTKTNIESQRTNWTTKTNKCGELSNIQVNITLNLSKEMAVLWFTKNQLVFGSRVIQKQYQLVILNDELSNLKAKNRIKKEKRERKLVFLRKWYEVGGKDKELEREIKKVLKD
jgi:hypothetical protein